MAIRKPVDKRAFRGPIGKSKLKQDHAQGLAIEALSFLAADGEQLERFLALSGLTPASLRAAAAAPGFLLAVLDHIAGDEALLVAFCRAAARDPRDVGRARETLAGRPPELSP